MSALKIQHRDIGTEHGNYDIDWGYIGVVCPP